MKSLACLLAFCFAPVAEADVQFDLITWDHVLLDPDYPALGVGLQWGLLVNTGDEPLDLLTWAGGLAYAATEPAIGSFGFQLSSGPGGVLQPGEAAGNTNPLLVAQLAPGETVSHAASLAISGLAISSPFPAGGFEVECFGQSTSRVVRTVTEFSYAPLDGEYYQPVSARRWSSESSSLSVENYGLTCSQVAGEPRLNAGAHDLPVLGNASFALDIGSPWFGGGAYALGISFGPFSSSFEGCEILIELAPSTLIQAGPLMVPFSTAQHFVPLPKLPALEGVEVFFQAVILSPLAENGSFATTNGVRARLGGLDSLLD